MMRDLSMHVMDIVQNSIVAGADSISVKITEDVTNDVFIFSIADNGCGMSKEIIEKVRNPFTTSRTTRKVGLGIPMLDQTCVQCGGSLHIDSEEKKGTTITATMGYNNIDRPPNGDLGEVMHMLIVTNPSLDFVYVHEYNAKAFTIDTKEIKEILGDDVSLNEPDVMLWIKESIIEGLEEIRSL